MKEKCVCCGAYVNKDWWEWCEDELLCPFCHWSKQDVRCAPIVLGEFNKLKIDEGSITV